MDREWYRRVDERDRGRQRLRRLTGWSVAGALAMSAGFGIALARHDQAAAATPTGQTQGSDDTGTGTVTDDGGSGGGVQPPAAPPQQTNQGGRHVSSGGS